MYHFFIIHFFRFTPIFMPNFRKNRGEKKSSAEVVDLIRLFEVGKFCKAKDEQEICFDITLNRRA